MTRRILLLTAREEADVLLHWLRSQAPPTVAVTHARTREELDNAIGDFGSQTRLLTFLSNVIVPASTLARLGPLPYNIHPGPPEYPGARPEQRALQETAQSYGVTGHVMVEQVDAGPIVYVDRFPVPAGIARLDFADLIYEHAVRAFGLIALHCLRDDAPLPELDYEWRSARPTLARTVRTDHGFARNGA